MGTWKTTAVSLGKHNLFNRGVSISNVHIAAINEANLFGMYPLVNVYITMERSTMLSMGKSTISTGPWLQ